MSFSKEVKEELAAQISQARHCQLAEFAALMHFIGQYGCDRAGNYTIGFHTENSLIVEKGFTLLKKTYNISNEIAIEKEQIQKLLFQLGNLEEPVNPLLLKNTCCQRAFLRGAFLSVGSISDPRKGYHLEFVCDREQQAEQLRSIIQGFDIEAKIVVRKKYYVVYLKEGSAIVDLLNVCEAPISLMNLENMRILKEMRNSVNRRVNRETANITKTVHAASRQIEDITYLRDYYGLQNLPENLRQMAEVRLENPDAPLKELGEYLQPTVGKSGVNHRLRKLSELAEQIREKRGGKL